MRIWDISPGYLNCQKLQEECKAIGELLSGLPQNPETGAADPEVLRWMKAGPALAQRHRAVVAEMRIQGGLNQQSVPRLQSTDGAQGEMHWPDAFLMPPSMQYAALRAEYLEQPPGRIPLPGNAQQLWAQHKYSVMARDPATYHAIGKRVAQMHSGGFEELAEELVLVLREAPQPGRLRNALEHMWGYVSDQVTADGRRAARQSPAALLDRTIELAVRLQEPYLLASTALSDLAAYTDDPVCSS